MDNVVPFTPRSITLEIEIPTPVNYRPGDVYYLIEYEEGDELPTSLFVQTKLLVRKGERQSGTIHALRTPRGTALARLKFLTPERVLCMPLMDGIPSGELLIHALDIIGWVDELYPEGWNGPRIVTLRDEAANVTMNLPVFHTSSNL